MLITTEKAAQFLEQLAFAYQQRKMHLAMPAGQTYLDPDSIKFGLEKMKLKQLENMLVLPLEPVMQAVQDFLYRPASEQGTLHLDEKAILRSEEIRLEINRELLQEKFRQLGLPDYLPPGLDKVLEMDPTAVSMRAIIPIEGEPVKLMFFIEQDQDRNFRIRDYELHVVHSVDILPQIIGDIRVQDLDDRMKQIDWGNESTAPWYKHLRIPDDHPDAGEYPAAKAISDVFRLAQHGPEGEAIAERLQMKHWYMAGLHNLIPRIDEVEERYRAIELVQLGSANDPTIQQTYRAIHERAAREQEEQRIAQTIQQMQAITWVPTGLEEILNPEYGLAERQEEAAQWEKIYSAKDQLLQLGESGPDGQEKMIRLLQTYWQAPDLMKLVDPLRLNVLSYTSMEDRQEVKNFFAKHHLLPPVENPDEQDRLFQLAAQGFYVAMNQEQRIIPADHIDRYIVQGHEYPRGMVYEIGHRLTRVMDTPDYEAARTAFEKAVDRNNDSMVSHALLGQFKGETLKVDYEGYPLHNTAMILVNHHNKQYPVTSEGLNYHAINPYEPTTLRLPVVVKIEPNKQGVRFYDHAFKPLPYATLQERRAAEHMQQAGDTHQSQQSQPAAPSPQKTGQSDQKNNTENKRYHRRRGRGF